MSDGYDGSATLVVDDTEVAVTVHLRGVFQPIDGRYHWYGRVETSAELTALLTRGTASAQLRTPHGTATGRLSDLDPWGRYRIDGVSTPPFAVATTL